MIISLLASCTTSQNGRRTFPPAIYCYKGLSQKLKTFNYNVIKLPQFYMSTTPIRGEDVPYRPENPKRIKRIFVSAGKEGQ